MKRRELIRHLERFGCAFLDEGAKHSRYINLADPARRTTIPRHTEIADLLARKICRQLWCSRPEVTAPGLMRDRIATPSREVPALLVTAAIPVEDKMEVHGGANPADIFNLPPGAVH